MAYIGRQLGQGVRNRFIYTATAGQTTFSGSDDNGGTLVYTDGTYVDVNLNGVELVSGTDYTATSGTSIVLTTGASLNDTLSITVYDVFAVADTVSAQNGGTFGGDISTKGDLKVEVASGGIYTITGTDTATNRTLTLPDNAGTVLTSASNIVANSGPAFRAYLSGNQSISSNVETVLTLDTENFDTDSCYNTSTYLFTPTIAGYYFSYVQLRWDVPLNQQCAFVVGIRKNGVPISTGQHDFNANSSTDSLTVTRSTLVYLNGTTDYLDFTGYQFIYTSQQSRNAIAGDSQTHAEAYLVRTA